MARSGMVVTNHPLASAAGMEMLAAGGNAIDAAVAAQFALTVVEPMMVGLIGGTTMHIRLADGRHTIIDGMSAVPARRPSHDVPADPRRRAGSLRRRGPGEPGRPEVGGHARLVARLVPGLAPVRHHVARRRDAAGDPHASRGFAVTPYLADCIVGASADLLQDPFIADRLLPDGDAAEGRRAPGPGRLRRGAGPDCPAGRDARCMAGRWATSSSSAWRGRGGFVACEDLTGYRVVERTPIRGQYRGWEIVGPAAARRVGRAYRADAEHPRRLRHRRPGLRHGRRRCICWPRS